MKKVTIAVLDLEMASLDIYDVLDEFTPEETESFIEATGHSSYIWGVFEGDIKDHRHEKNS